MRRILGLSFFLLTTTVIKAQDTQTIRGTVIDKDSKYPLVGVSIVLVDSNPIVGTVTDLNGNFELHEVPIGRQSFILSFVGYKESRVNNLLVLSGKELSLNLELEESVMALDEIVVFAQDDKLKINNGMATVSARAFDLEETTRYAGSLNDPARMASNFAGITNANDGRNDIIIRGNSPNGLLWRLEGIDIPNPNHYGSFGTTGGPVSILNNNQLAKSDFLTAAFPAEYGNATAGIFDLQLRNGNQSKREYLAQIGFNGFELGAEGPFSPGGRGSYLVNYRYSTLGVFETLGFDFGTGAAVPQYQDISFKVNLPVKTGRFTVFGVGGISEIELLGSEHELDSEDLFGNETEDIYNDNTMGVLGVSYTHFFNSKTFAKLTLGGSHANFNVEQDSLIFEGDETIIDIIRNQNIDNTQNKYTVHFTFNKKLNAKNTVVTGTVLDRYNFDFKHHVRIPDTDQFKSNRSFDGTSLLTRIYLQWQHKFSDKFSLNTGAQFQNFELSNSNNVEPRVGLKYQFKHNQSFGLGYGLHSQLQPLPLYFQDIKLSDGTIVKSNEDLDFVRSHHFVVSYDRNFGSDLRLKLETYYQYIFDAGVDNFPSTFSTLNIGADFDVPDKGFLVNEGTGKNYGIELTLEKFFSHSYYFLLTTSLFESEYQPSDGEWRNTAFNGKYVLNLLGGKEWKIGGKNNVLAVDTKLTTAGGRYYTPIDLKASAQTGYEVLLEDLAFTERFDDYFRMDLKVSYRMNRPKTTHEFSLDVRNITNRENDFLRNYNRRTNTVTIEKQVGLFPIPQYKLYF